MDCKVVHFFVVLLWKLVFSEIISQPFVGQHEEHVSIQSVNIQDTSDGNRQVTVTFTASNTPQILWEVDNRPVMYYDTNFLTMSSPNTATLRMSANVADERVKFNIILHLYQESVLIRMSSATPGLYPVPSHTLDVTPSEGLTYNDTTDLDSVNVDAVLWVDDIINYHRLRLNIMVIIPDYCRRPIEPLFGFSSSNPDMLGISYPDDNEVFGGMDNWRTSYPEGHSEAQRIHVTSVSQPSWKQGMLVVGSEFDGISPSNPIINIYTIRRVFFKPAPLFQDYILENTVTFIGWNHDLVVDEHEDADFHIFAIGNPVPRITIAKNGVDISTMVERRDIAEAYFKHAIFRFRNITVEDSGRYVCTAMSGSGRIKETFTVYVRTTCSSGQ